MTVRSHWVFLIYLYASQGTRKELTSYSFIMYHVNRKCQLIWQIVNFQKIFNHSKKIRGSWKFPWNELGFVSSLFFWNNLYFLTNGNLDLLCCQNLQHQLRAMKPSFLWKGVPGPYRTLEFHAAYCIVTFWHDIQSSKCLQKYFSS